MTDDGLTSSDRFVAAFLVERVLHEREVLDAMIDDICRAVDAGDREGLQERCAAAMPLWVHQQVCLGIARKRVPELAWIFNAAATNAVKLLLDAGRAGLGPAEIRRLLRAQGIVRARVRCRHRVYHRARLAAVCTAGDFLILGAK